MEGIYVWPGDIPVTDEQWHPHEPNDAYITPEEDCVFGDTESLHKWHDDDCQSIHYFICESATLDFSGTGSYRCLIRGVVALAIAQALLPPSASADC